MQNMWLGFFSDQPIWILSQFMTADTNADTNIMRLKLNNNFGQLFW